MEERWVVTPLGEGRALIIGETLGPDGEVPKKRIVADCDEKEACLLVHSRELLEAGKRARDLLIQLPQQDKKHSALIDSTLDLLCSTQADAEGHSNLLPRKVFGNCSVCGRTMYFDDQAYATTTGIIEEGSEGFSPSEMEPWATVACHSCGQKISEAIADLSKAAVEETKSVDLRFTKIGKGGN